MISTLSKIFSRGFSFLGCLALASTAAAAPDFLPNEAIRSQTLMNLIAKEGAPQAVETLLRSPEQWLSVLRRLETGASEWLMFAADLNQGATGKAALDLRRSLALALPRNASGVLRLISADVNIDYLCAASLNMNDQIEKRKYLREALHSLATLNDEDLRDHRSLCLQTIQQIQQSLEISVEGF